MTEPLTFIDLAFALGIFTAVLLFGCGLGAWLAETRASLPEPDDVETRNARNRAAWMLKYQAFARARRMTE
jgi:hypothetical protein